MSPVCKLEMSLSLGFQPLRGRRIGGAGGHGARKGFRARRCGCGWCPRGCGRTGRKERQKAVHQPRRRRDLRRRAGHARDVSLTLGRPSATPAYSTWPPPTVVGDAGTDIPGHVLVRLNADATPLLARITRRSGNRLGIAGGLAVWAQIKAVSLAGIVCVAEWQPGWPSCTLHGHFPSICQARKNVLLNTDSSYTVRK